MYLPLRICNCRYRNYANKNARSNLAQEIQFGEFMGGSNLAQGKTN